MNVDMVMFRFCNSAAMLLATIFLSGSQVWILPVFSNRKAGGGGRFSMLPLLLLRDIFGREVFSMDEVRRTGGGGLGVCTEPRRESVPLFMVQYPAKKKC